MTDTPESEALRAFGRPDEPDLWPDIESARKVPGVYTNRVFVQPLGDGMLRINFGQISDEEPSYHNAIVVTAHNAIAFAELIARYGRSLLVAPPPIVRVNTPPPPGDGNAV